MIEPLGTLTVEERGKVLRKANEPENRALGYELAELSGMHQEPVPEEARVWAAVLLTETVFSGCERYLQQLRTPLLREMRRALDKHALKVPALLEMLELPQLGPEGGTWGRIATKMGAELTRRNQQVFAIKRDKKAYRSLAKTMNVEEVIGAFVQLQPSGRNYKALRPFHADSKPSFYLYSGTRRWHCFGACARGGDVVDFLQELRSIGRI